MTRKITIIIEDDGQQPVEQIINPFIYPTIPGPSWVPWIPTPLPQQLPGDSTGTPYPTWQPYIICAVPTN